eukprot:Skav202719  [mRNA]  locus=scaffold654:831019:832236:+ [translate_table: standard]
MYRLDIVAAGLHILARLCCRHDLEAEHWPSSIADPLRIALDDVSWLWTWHVRVRREVVSNLGKHTL